MIFFFIYKLHGELIMPKFISSIPTQLDLLQAVSYNDKINVFSAAADIIQKNLQDKNAPSYVFSFTKLQSLKNTIEKDATITNAQKAILIQEIGNVYDTLKLFHPKNNMMIKTLENKISSLTNQFYQNVNNNLPCKRKLDFTLDNRDFESNSKRMKK